MRPIVFGFIFAAVLFPLKQKIANYIEYSIDYLSNDENGSFLFIVTTRPFKLISRIGKLITSFGYNHIKVLTTSILSLIALRLSLHFISFNFLWTFIDIFSWTPQIFEPFNEKIILTIIIGYVLAIIFYWDESRAKGFLIAGQVLWMLLIAFISTYFGSFQVPVFIGENLTPFNN
jgi:hypothetical protein